MNESTDLAQTHENHEGDEEDRREEDSDHCDCERRTLAEKRKVVDEPPSMRIANRVPRLTTG